jgi:hypothetical protein
MADDKPESRSDNLASKKGVEKKLTDLYRDVQKGFEDQAGRSSDTNENWDIYNCILGRNQTYDGFNQLFIPATYNAVEARVTRFSNQIFPSAGRHIEVTSSDASRPRALTALAEHYIRKAKLRLVIPALLVNGDIEGHYWTYSSWNKSSRHITTKVKSPAMLGGMPTGEESDDMEVDREVFASHPDLEILSDSDVVVLPATAKSLDDALNQGGSVTILRRWSEPKIQSLIDKGLIDKAKGDKLIKEMSKHPAKLPSSTDQEKGQVHAAGIKGAGRGKHALVYETWTKKISDRITQTFFGSPDMVLHCHRNPLWCDRLPIIGHPLRKLHGCYKGNSPINKGVAALQYSINDTANQAADSSLRAMSPVVMTDPLGNPRYDSMVQATNAVWKCSPNSTKVLDYPQLWQDAEGIIQAKEASIMQTLGVNPSMITQGFKKSKPSQSEVATEHAVDLLTTSNVVTGIEEGQLTPIISLWMEMDHQYRDETITVQTYGELGKELGMEEIDPIQMDCKYVYLWFGVEQVRNAQQMQQQIATLNVVQKIPGQMYPEYVIDMSGIVVDLIDSAWGPSKGRTIFRKLKSPEDQQMKTLQLMLGGSAGANPASGGGGPKPGAQPGQGKPGGQNPPGAVHQDHMAVAMPRKAG